MSKIGKTPITIKEGIQVTLENNIVKIVGTKGESTYTIPEGIAANLAEGKLSLTLVNTQDRTKRAMYGLTRANLANLVKGVDTGFERKLELVGVGYRAQMQGNDLVLSLGSPEPGIKISVAENAITIAGMNKALVGLTAAKIRGVKPPEPYKGKGIKYKGEQIRRKAGKAAKAVGGK
jgi:large subunit ribosomal protein L6